MNTLRLTTLLLACFLPAPVFSFAGSIGENAAKNPLSQAPDSVFGYIFHDTDGDCVRDSFETAGYAGLNVTLTFFGAGAVTETFLTATDTNGYYVFNQLADVGNFSGAFLVVQTGADPAGGLYCPWTGCPLIQQFGPVMDPATQVNFGLQCDSLPPCPILDVDIATGVIRPCSTSYFQVQYCNIGAEPALDASVEVTMDPALTVTGSSIPWASVSGNVYTFELGNLNSGQCGGFSIQAAAPCNDPVGTTYCVEAHAYPDTCSLPPGPDWDGAQIEVSAECAGDSVVFTIQNVGVGDMGEAQDYVVVEDNVLLMTGNFQLGAGESIQVVFPADGSFFRLQAGQSPGFPGLNLPVAWLEGCGGSAGLGFVNQYPLNDYEPWLDVFCLESVNSYDPNDKQGFPRGYGDEHFIEQNVDLEYLIRFQNTGTAPALTVEIRDTIPVQWLDPATVRPGASSHDYDWDMQGSGVVVFKFPGINLPDSSADYEASNGFVKFTVSQRPDVPLGTVIENDAAIFFDNNPPVITNTTWHTVGEDFIVLSSSVAVELFSAVKVVLAPNPAHDRARLQMEGLENADNLIFQLRSALGQPVLVQPFSGPGIEFDTSQLPAGVYFFDIGQLGRAVVAGKLIKK